MLSPTNADRLALRGKASGTRIPAALLTALALAAAAGCSSTTPSASPAPAASSSASHGSSGTGSTDQQAAAAIAVRNLHDLGANDYADLCAIFAPGSSILATGIDGCTNRIKVAMAADQQAGTDDFLSKASELTVNASKVIVNGDSATVPVAAVLYQGQPVTQFQGMHDERLIRKNGQWYVVAG